VVDPQIIHPQIIDPQIIDPQIADPQIGELFNSPGLVVKLLRAARAIPASLETNQKGGAPAFKWPSLKQNSAAHLVVLRRE
jgi:hypothetical protein